MILYNMQCTIVHNYMSSDDDAQFIMPYIMPLIATSEMVEHFGFLLCE